MSQVFISYAREDKEFVDRLVRDLEAEKFDVWIDRDDIRAGEGWVGAISKAIGDCAAFIIVMSSYSVNSKTVERELFLADQYDKHILPLFVQTSVLSPNLKLLLGARQWIDFEGGDYARATRMVLDALRQGPQPFSKSGPVDGPENPPPPHQPPLAQVLIGRWTVTINFPMMPPFTLTVWLGPDGSFRAQLPTGAFAQGGWSVNFGKQVLMQGVETFGMMSRPFFGQINVTDYGPHHLNGFGPQGEPVSWRRFG